MFMERIKYVMKIKATSTQSNYIIECGRNFYLINLNSGKLLNKSSFFLWLKPQKVLVLTNSEYDLLNKSGIFKNGVSIVLPLGLALIILAMFGNTLETLSFSLNKSILLLIAIIMPCLLFLMIKRKAIKDKEKIEILLNRKLIGIKKISLIFKTRKEKIIYNTRMILGFFVCLTLVIIGMLVFLYTGLFVGLLVYVISIVALFGTSIPLPNNIEIKEVE